MIICLITNTYVDFTNNNNYRIITLSSTISHLTLFGKLIDGQICLYMVMKLCHGYQHQEMSVKWGQGHGILNMPAVSL